MTKSNRFSTMRPRQVEAYLREQVRKLWGDEIENTALIISSHGYYTVQFSPRPGLNASIVSFANFRKQDAGRIARAMRELKGEK